MTSVFGITAPVFILIGIGFVLIKSNLLNKTHVGGFGTFVVYLALPSLIISTLTKTSLDHIIQPTFMIIYAVASLGSFALGFIIYRKFFNKTFSNSALNSFGGAMSNSAFIGYPLLLQSFSNPPVAAFTMALMVESILLLPVALFFLEVGESHGKGHSKRSVITQISKRLISNPVILAIFAGIVLALLNIQLPTFIDKSVGLLAQAAAPVALVFIGATLASSQWHGKLDDAGMVALFKLVVHPALVFLMIVLMPSMGANLSKAAILIASVPMVSIFPIIGSKYGQGPQAASTMLVTTILAFFSISAILWLYH